MQLIRAYIDDSGEKEYGDRTSRHFVYGGLLVASEDEAAIEGAIRAAKIRVFGREDVELKSNWVRVPKERERRYLRPFGITAEELDDCVEALYSIFDDPRVSLLASVIDKRLMRERYGERAYYPSSYGYRLLLQRVQRHCAALGRVGSVTIDDMSGASPANNQWRDLLKAEHRRLKRDGCDHTKLRFDNITESLRFADSSRFHLLQAADFVAYNVLRQFRNYGEDWDAGPTCRVYQPFARMLPRFLASRERVFDGYGIVKFPSPRRGRYRLP